MKASLSPSSFCLFHPLSLFLFLSPIYLPFLLPFYYHMLHFYHGPTLLSSHLAPLLPLTLFFLLFLLPPPPRIMLSSSLLACLCPPTPHFFHSSPPCLLPSPFLIYMYSLLTWTLPFLIFLLSFSASSISPSLLSPLYFPPPSLPTYSHFPLSPFLSSYYYLSLSPLIPFPFLFSSFPHCLLPSPLPTLFFFYYFSFPFPIVSFLPFLISSPI